MIYPDEEDRCLKCKCGSNWTNNISQMIKQCERLSCDLEDGLLNQGCLPIYENKCCPNNYHCRKYGRVGRLFFSLLFYNSFFSQLSSKTLFRFEFFFSISILSSHLRLSSCAPTFRPRTASEEVAKKEPFKTGKCYFNGKNYEVGSKLKTDNPCMECVCKVPPYHTCTMISKCDE